MLEGLFGEADASAFGGGSQGVVAEIADGEVHMGEAEEDGVSRWTRMGE